MQNDKFSLIPIAAGTFTGTTNHIYSAQLGHDLYSNGNGKI